MKYKNKDIYYFLILIFFLLTKNIQGIKLNKNSPTLNSSDFSEPTDSPVFPIFLDMDTLNTQESKDSSENSDSLEPSDIPDTTNPIDYIESSDSSNTPESLDSSESIDLLEQSDTLYKTNTIDSIEPLYSSFISEISDTFAISDSTFPSDSTEIPFPSDSTEIPFPSDSTEIPFPSDSTEIPIDSSEIIVYEPIIIYNITMNESTKTFEIQLNRVIKANKSEENLEAYIGLEFDSESCNEINLELFTEIHIDILFYENENIDEIINNNITANKTFTNPLKMRTFYLENLNRYYFRIIQPYYTNITTTNENYTLKIHLNNDSYYKIDDNYYNKTQNNFTFYYKRDKQIMFENKTIILTFLSSSIKDFDVRYSIFEINDINEEKTETPLKKTFFNGYSLIINDNLFPKDINENYIKFKLLLDDNNKEFIQIEARKFANVTKIDIDINNRINVIINDEIKEECFSLNQTNGETQNNEYILDFLSLTKNINFSYFQDFTLRKGTEFPIDKESMSKQMKIAKDYFFCFYKNNEEYLGSVSFEIKQLKNNGGESIVIPNNYIIRDLWTRHYLYQGTASLYKPEVYNMEELFAKINFHIIKGHPLLYIVYCNSINSINSNCFFNEEKILNMKEYKDINGFISDKKDLTENLTALVYCKKGDQGCEFDIEIKNEEENTYLFSNFRIHTFSFEKDEIYKINTKDIFNIINYDLYIDINSFLIKPEVEFSKDLTNLNIKEIEKFYTEKNKLSYQIPGDEIKNNNCLLIKIKGKLDTNFYYGINFQLKSKENTIQSIENNILYHYQLKETNQIEFDFNDKDPNYESSYILNLNTFGNNLILNKNGQSIKPYNDLIQVELKNTDSFTIKKEKDNDLEKYLFNIEYHEISKHNKIFIENGFLYKNRINSDQEAIYYFILFKNDDTKNIIINFRKISDISMNITICSIENDICLIDKTVEQLSKIIVLEKEKIQCNEKYNNYATYCEYEIKIKLSKDLELNNKNFDFSIQLTKNGNNYNETYLPQNTFMSNLLFFNTIQTYYFEIEKGKVGKIYIDFLEGQGFATGKIIGKDFNEDLIFEYIEKYFKINYEKTKNCEDICTIYINLFLGEEYQYNDSYKYNIYTIINNKTNDIFYFNMPETEFIYGNLEDDNSIDYYKLNITKKSKKIAVYTYCDDCLINITDINNLINKENNILFKDIIILELPSDNFELKYRIKNNKLVSKQRYSIRVISYENETTLYIPMNSIRNTFCQIKKDVPCHFLVPRESYNNVEKIILLVPKFEDANIIIENGINNLEISNKKYIEYNINEDENDKIYKIKVELNYDANITFVSLHYKIIDKSMIYTYPEDYTIVNFENNKDFQISPLIKQGFLHYDINLVKGKGYISLPNKDENFYLEYGIKENLNLLFEYNSESNIHINSDKDNSTFYFRVVSNINNNNNLVEMNFQKSNYFKYINFAENSEIWPLNFFMEINMGNNELSNSLKDINFNYKFWKTYKNNYFSPFNESYNSEIYLVDTNFIAQNKFNYPEKEKSNKLECISKYRYDFTMGYDLISFNTILEEIQKNNEKKYNYLLISINYTQTLEEQNDKDINCVLTAFDFSKNNILPINEYLFMLINQPRQIKIGNELVAAYNTFIEYALNEVNCTIDSNSCLEEKIYGKTFVDLNPTQTYIMNFTQFSDNKKEIPNVLIKQGLSIDNNHSYFIINNSSINYSNYTIENSNGSISFDRVIVNNQNVNNNNEENDLYIIYTIKLFQVENNFSINPDSIYETEKKPIKIFKYIDDNNNDENPVNISINISLGYYYIYILAEARKGNIYEYLSYNPLYIEKIADEQKENIIIDSQEKHFTPNYTREVKYRVSNIILDNGDYIKLSLKHKNFYDKNEIYVSKFDTIWESNNLYNDSLFKVIDRETSLIIPVNEVFGAELFIKIPCIGLCDYTFYYVQYKKDNISIKENECFDIDLNVKPLTFYYYFKNKNEASLITVTSNSLDSFSIEENEFLFSNSYFNGYSLLIKPEQYKDKTELKFKIEQFDKIRIINVCHRFITEIGDNIDYAKKIFVGDIKYSRFDNIKDCFSFYKYEEEETNYRLNLITKSKNLNLMLFKKNNSNGEELDIPDEFSFSREFNSSYDGFCFTFSEKDNSLEKSVLFQLLSVENNNSRIQPLVMPLIKGISTKQTLKKDEILYYRIKENNLQNPNIRVYFQTLSGIPNIYESKCKDYPNCYFDKEKLKNMPQLELNNNNLYYNIEIKEKEDIYQTSEFPVIIVHCTGDMNDKDECNFYIEMSNDNNFNKILLNENRKIYSFIEYENQTQTYQIIIPANIINNDDNSDKKIYIQLHSFTGKFESNIIEKKYNKENYNLYNDNGMFYSNVLSSGYNNFTININGSNSYFSLFYYFTDNKENYIYLPSGEVHYCIITKSKKYKYHFQDYSKTTFINYVVSLNAINCDIYANNKPGRNFQFIINSNETIDVTSGLNIEDKCEFTISAVDLKNNGNTSELIFNDRTYHYYEFSNKFNIANIDYLISKNELEKKEIYLYINKKSNKTIKISYNIDHEESIINDYNQIIKLTEFNNINEKFNLYHLKITIKSEEEVTFKFKINGNKNKYSYLDIEEIENEIIKNKEENKYYYEYYNNFPDLQIYLDSNGLSKFRNISVYYKNKTVYSEEGFNGFFINNNNFLNLKNNKICDNGCKIYFSINLTEEIEFNNYKIYILSNYKPLMVQNNININGNILGGKHLFKTIIFDNEIIFNLNCLNCKLVFYFDSDIYTLKKSEIIKLKGTVNSSKTLNFYVERDNSNNGNNDYNQYYYYFSIINKNSSRFINQGDSNICFSECTFFLPLYPFDLYKTDYIILYIPENDNAIIDGQILPLNSNYEEFYNFYFQDENQSEFIKSQLTNRLIVNITNLKKIGALIKINVACFNTTFNFIVSEFFKSLYNSAIYPQNIMMINNDTKKNILGNKKIKAQLINGNGYISLNNKNYSLDYETQEIVYILNENYETDKVDYFSTSEEDFIFYVNIERENQDFDLQINKTTYFKFLKIDKNSKISFNINDKQIKDLYINFHFSKLEKKGDIINPFNSSDEKFAFWVNDDEIKNINFTNKHCIYNHEQRRGYIYLSSSFINGKDYLNINIESKKYNYENIYLEITPIYIDNDIIIPRNVYLEFKIDKQNIIFSKPNQDYKHVKCEILCKNSFDISINNKSISLNEQKCGKYYFSLEDQSLNYSIKINKNETDNILIKCMSKKNNISAFVKDIDEEKDITISNKEGTNIYNITHKNNLNVLSNNYKNYKITYLIRLYNVLDYKYDSQINNIFGEINTNNTFRKELEDKELNLSEVTYNIIIKNLPYGEYRISIIGEVYNNDNVEYYFYGLKKYEKIQIKIVNFDKSWIAPLIIVIIIFILLVVYLVKAYIDKKKEKKNNNSEDRKFLTNTTTSQ